MGMAPLAAAPRIIFALSMMRAPMTLRILLSLAVVVSMSLAAPSAALDLSAVISDYRITSWAGGDGFALGEILSITQDRDGYLWL